MPPFYILHATGPWEQGWGPCAIVTDLYFLCVLQAIRVRMNFGERPFVYAEGQEHRDAANIQEQDTTEEVRYCRILSVYSSPRTAHY